MNGEQLIRLVEAIHRDKEIDTEIIFRGIEAAVETATKKHLGRDGDIRVELDRETGELRAFEDEEPIDPIELGRIAAQSAKQIMIQKIREAERDVIFQEFEHLIGAIVTGIVQRYEGGGLIVGIEKVDGILSKNDLIPGDSYRPGDTLRAVISEVKKTGQRVGIFLSRSSNDFVIRLFELEVPEINEGLVEVKAIARIPGYRTKVAIKSNDSRVDSVGACVGVRGSRIKNIVAELNGEKIDIIEWSDSPENLIVNALKPAEISGLEIDDESASAKVIVTQDQLSLAIGKRGQNVRLATRLTGWQLQIVTEEQDIAAHDAFLKDLVEFGGVTEDVAQIIISAGYDSVADIVERGAEILASIEGVEEEQAASIVEKLKKHLADKPSEEEEEKKRDGDSEETAQAEGDSDPDAAEPQIEETAQDEEVAEPDATESKTEDTAKQPEEEQI